MVPTRVRHLSARARRGAALATIFVLLSAAASGCTLTHAGGPPRGPEASGGPPASVRPDDAEVARAQLGGLRIAPADRGGYQRTRDFGPAWSADVDRNGCRQRDDVLRRDLREVELRNRCTVVAGVLADPYTGRTVLFRKADADAVQVDHVYPLAAAWAHGARGWTQEQRVRFANELDNLLATSAEANLSKGDGTPAEWRPRPAFRCAYAVRYVHVAARFDLTVSAADRRALGAMLAACPRPHRAG
jgi:hypothetical protein